MAAPGDHRLLYSAGIHPWDIAQFDLAKALDWLHGIATQSEVVAIGECGLDQTLATALPRQSLLFCQQIELAEQLRKPLIIHCVRAFAELLALRKRCRPRQTWIMHGFRGKPALAAQLIDHGVYLSFGKALLHSATAQASLASTPLPRLFLETDDASEIAIGEIYAVAAKILSLEPSALQRQIVANFERVFPHD